MFFCLVFHVELVINGFILMGKSALTKGSFGLSLEMVSFCGHHEVNTKSTISQLYRLFRIKAFQKAKN